MLCDVGTALASALSLHFPLFVPKPIPTARSAVHGEGPTDFRSSTSLEVLREVHERGGQPCRVILRGDSIRDVVGNDVDACSSVDFGDLPGHRHRAGVGGIVGVEVHCLHDPHAGTRSMNRDSTMSVVALALPGEAEASA